MWENSEENVENIKYTFKFVSIILQSITKDDELPQRACSICISYLKHAYTFRQQALDTICSLRLAKALGELSTKENDLQQGIEMGSASMMPNYQNANPDGGNKFFKSNVIPQKYAPNRLAYDEQEMQRELELFFDDEDDENDAEDSETGSSSGCESMQPTMTNGQAAAARSGAIKEAINNFFNYSEKRFAEDDLSDFPGITVKEPEDDHKERKCFACKRLFMLTESFDAHMKDCVQSLLFTFVSSTQKLVELKKEKMISAQEFTRRMIFAVKGCVKSLAMCYQITAKQPMRSSVNTDVSFATKTLPKQMFQSIDRTSLPTDYPEINQQFAAAAAITPVRFPKVPNFAAKCPACKQLFDSIQALEEHNQRNHNNSSRSATNSVSDVQSVYDSDDQRSVGSRNALWDLLQEADAMHDGIVNVERFRQRKPQVESFRLTKNNLSAYED